MSKEIKSDGNAGKANIEARNGSKKNSDIAGTDKGRREMLDLIRKGAVKAAISAPVVMTLKATPASATSTGSNVS